MLTPQNFYFSISSPGEKINLFRIFLRNALMICELLKTLCVLNYPFVDILSIADIQFRNIDVIQEILIFESADRTESLLYRGKRLQEIVGQAALMVVIIAGNSFSNCSLIDSSVPFP